jgi:hypothetical protein
MSAALASAPPLVAGDEGDQAAVVERVPPLRISSAAWRHPGAGGIRIDRLERTSTSET